MGETERDRRGRPRSRDLLGVFAALAAAGALALWIRRSESLPDGPEPVVWDRALCAECQMSVSDRAYAAQLQTKDGRVLNYDDPGCLFRYLRRHDPPVHAVYYRHLREDRWVPESGVEFIVSGPSPMGFDLGAVAAGETGAMSPAEARDFVRSRRFRTEPMAADSAAGAGAIDPRAEERHAR